MNFGEVNKDAYSVALADAAPGPLVGFFGAFKTAVDAQTRAASQFGVEAAMHELDWQQTQSLFEAGVEAPPQLISQLTGDEGQYRWKFSPLYASPYFDAAKFLSGTSDTDRATKQRLQAYDDQILKLREQYPSLGLRTSGEMFSEVRKRAQVAEFKDLNERRTVGGRIGGFLGAAVSSFNPNTDPLNFLTVGVGGAGETALSRIAAQGFGQGAIEAVNQVTGVQTERQVLGLSHGPADALARIGGQVVAGAGLQALGEGAAKVFGHFFRGNAADAVPEELLALPPPPKALPPPTRELADAAALERNPAVYRDMLADQAPLSGIRYERARTHADIEDIRTQLEDWGSGDVVSLRPRTRNATYAADATGPGPAVDVGAAVEHNRVYQAARAIDPQTFTKLEALAPKRETYRTWIGDLTKDRNADIDAALSGIETRLDALHAKHKTTQGKTNKLRIREEIKKVQQDREALIVASRAKETPDIAMVRESLARVDEQMRELAPALGRAYAQARGKWAPDATDVAEALVNSRSGRVNYDPSPRNDIPDYDTAVSLYDRVPVLQKATTVEPKATVTDTVQAVVEDEIAKLDEMLEAQRASLGQVLGETSDGKLRVGNHEFDLDKDKIWVANEDGEGGAQVSIRQLLERQRDDEMKLEAIQTCSMPRRS